MHFTVHNVYRSDDGRILLINMEYEQNVITLLNIYAPNSENERCIFFQKVCIIDFSILFEGRKYYFR
jgi:hypothetical protein